jgi:hypothetical protein
MSWVTFNVVQGNGNTVADGQLNFTFTLSNNNTTLNAGATLQYSPSAASPPPNSTTILTTTSAINLANGVFALPGATLTNKFNIPGKGSGFNGGHYNTLSNCTFNPSTSVIQGLFTDVGIANSSDPCDWQASASSPEPEIAKKAAY